MQYHLRHSTTYKYDRPVALSPHLLRLQPRSGGAQSVQHYEAIVNPLPLHTSSLLDLAGNTITQLRFAPDQLLTSLEIITTAQVTTHCTNPFDYLLEPWAVTFPINYPTSVLSQLQGYFAPLAIAEPLDPIVYELAIETSQAVDHNTSLFLTALSQRIYTSCTYQIRETGSPLPAGITWRQKSGSCRDLTVLFIAACRAMGLAARFVSGYTEGEPEAAKYLHAWAEVYLPGGGWRGFDPTLGLAVADRHIPLAAAALPPEASPLTGSLRQPGILSTMTYTLDIQPLSSP